MPFSLKVALRHLASSPAQTLLLIGGVAVSAFLFVFIASLINGLRDTLVKKTIGNLAHIVLEPKEQTARLLVEGNDFGVGQDSLILDAYEKANFQRDQIRNWQSFVDIAARTNGVTVISPEMVGNGFLIRGQAVAPVSVVGILPERINAMANIEANLVQGDATLDLSSIVLGKKLAEKLGLRIGQSVVLRSDRDRERTLLLRGIYDVGVSSLDERIVYVNIRVARGLFDLAGGVTQIELKVDDLFKADQFAEELASATGLKSTPWTEGNKSLRDGLNAQGRSGMLIQGFSLITVVVGVASALLLTTYRRRNEIGIMRSFGVSKSFIATIFVLQGMIVGMGGAIVGAAGGYQLCAFLRDSARLDNGDPLLPFDPAQGAYVEVIVLTTIGSMLAAIWPARAATRVDPVEVISQ